MNKIFITTLIVTISIFSNSAFSVPLIQPKPNTGTGTSTGTGTTTGSTTVALSAVNDEAHVVPGKNPTATGNVTSNDKGFTTTYLQSSPVSSYGYLEFSSDGVFTYTLNDNADLKGNPSVKDKFTYAIQSSAKTATATLTVTIYASQVEEKGLDNVEIEFNNRSALATPLNSTQRIKGHLYASSDKDWYSIASPGDDVIHIGVCESGSVCYGKKSWVMYVFDGDKLTSTMENATVPLRSFRADGVNGGNSDGSIAGRTINSNDMYLAYQSDVFEGALIGIVDPCFDKTNSVDIGAATGARTYYVAISVPLKRDGTGCSDGSVVLKKSGLPYDTHQTDSSGKAITIPTTDEYIAAYPNSDDEYAITVSSTGVNPLAVSGAPASASAAAYAISQTAMPSFNDSQHQLNIPKLRIFNSLYSATLSYKGSLLKKSVDSNLAVTLSVKKITGLAETLSGDPYQATYNPENDQVVLSTMRDSKTGSTYSAVLKYHPALGKKPVWLEAISIGLIQ